MLSLFDDENLPDKSCAVSVRRSQTEPIRKNISWDERWKSHDKGLINCWEVGRLKAVDNPVLAKAAQNDELPKLGWDGGHSETLKAIEMKYGTFNYLAQWQGLRGDDLDIDFDRDEGKVLTCSKTNMRTIFTGNMDHFKG